RDGTNLFHSFAEFSGGASFEVDPAVRNVIIRVTGESPAFISEINAQITGSSNRSAANILFVDPRGIVFDGNITEPKIAIDGAFHAVSALEVRFAEGAAFSVATATSALAAAVPIGFGFTEPGISSRIAGDSLDFEGGSISLADAGVIRNRSIHFHGNTVALVGTNVVDAKRGLDA